MEVKVAAFVDSVDGARVLAGGAYYPKGICGEKEMTLDPGSPDFLTISADAVDPILNDLTISYDESKATLSDIKVHTINYTVVLKEYGADVTSLHGSFEIEIVENINELLATLVE